MKNEIRIRIQKNNNIFCSLKTKKVPIKTYICCRCCRYNNLNGTRTSLKLYKTVSHISFLHFFTKTRKTSGKTLANYIENSTLTDGENMLLVTHQDRDDDNYYDDCNKSNTNRVNETMPSSTDKESTLRL